MTEITSAWTRLKTLSMLSEAMNCANDYKTSLSQLKTEFVHFRSLQNDCDNYQGYIDETNEQISDDQCELSGVLKAQMLMESQISQLEELIEPKGSEIFSIKLIGVSKRKRI